MVVLESSRTLGSGPKSAHCCSAHCSALSCWALVGHSGDWTEGIVPSANKHKFQMAQDQRGGGWGCRTKSWNILVQELNDHRCYHSWYKKGTDVVLMLGDTKWQDGSKPSCYFKLWSSHREQEMCIVPFGGFLTGFSWAKPLPLICTCSHKLV